MKHHVVAVGARSNFPFQPQTPADQLPELCACRETTAAAYATLPSSSKGLPPLSAATHFSWFEND
jgi:hypothetical protein